MASARKLYRETPKLATGGYTGQGAGRTDSTGHRPAGIVHAGEWVAPKWMVDHPVFGERIGLLESLRQRGYAAGGMVDTTPTAGPGGGGGMGMEATAEAKRLRDEVAGLRYDLNAWQRSLRVQVKYQDIEDAGVTLGDIRAEAAL
jgi:hypothetical protein